MNIRSATFFNRLARVSSEMQILQTSIVSAQAHEKAIVEQKSELDRIYKMIEISARAGGIRVFIQNTDPVWENKVVIQELRNQGFSVSPHHHRCQGAIEWYAARYDELA